MERYVRGCSGCARRDIRLQNMGKGMESTRTNTIYHTINRVVKHENKHVRNRKKNGCKVIGQPLGRHGSSSHNRRSNQKRLRLYWSDWESDWVSIEETEEVTESPIESLLKRLRKWLRVLLSLYLCGGGYMMVPKSHISEMIRSEISLNPATWS